MAIPRRARAFVPAWVLALGLACTAVQAVSTTRSLAPEPTDDFPDVARAYWVEIDGRPTWAGQPDEALPMASLAKLMTALLVAESGRLDEELTVSAGAAHATGTRLGLRAGERFLAADLFTATLVRSANDACRALADWQGGDLATFVARMNARAAELGLHDTRFGNACGHDAPGQGSSVRDLAALARVAMAQPRIAAEVKRSSASFSSLGGRRFEINSTNALLRQFPGTLGVKTGYTPGAGRCLIALVQRDGHEVLVVMLHAPDRWWDTVALIELAFAHARERGATRP
ncbi:D-alanyl-D-alanine carboxypeptidase family protein [Arenimonas sp. MALMAid1274]|uniref:D-alanyl-D-alanine carboxypeptidase family protein n=1 Tax=Arenimonas sp. MALMAid1274 TaxID=3411630 RepID=UPI003BA380AD